jgi:hypothetical protein
MEYGESIEASIVNQPGVPNVPAPLVPDSKNWEICDRNYDKYVGWRGGLPGFENLFKRDSVMSISKRISIMLQGVDPDGKEIVVMPNNICAILSSVYESYRPETGDIHSRYIISSSPQQYLNDIVDRAINIIVSQVRDNIMTENKNRGLSIWTTVLGESNPHGLRSHPRIKIREKHPAMMQFNMRY